MLIGYDIDGVLTDGIEPEDGSVVVSGRTWAEYDQTAKSLAQRYPVYIRGKGEYRDHIDAALFKIAMIHLLGIDEFHEDHPLQVDLISRACPHVRIVAHGRAAAL